MIGIGSIVHIQKCMLLYFHNQFGLTLIVLLPLVLSSISILSLVATETTPKKPPLIRTVTFVRPVSAISLFSLLLLFSINLKPKRHHLSIFLSFVTKSFKMGIDPV